MSCYVSCNSLVIVVLSCCLSGAYTVALKSIEDDIASLSKQINVLKGIKESDTGLSAPSLWDLVADKQMMQSEAALQVARCTKIIAANTAEAKYIINVRQIAKYVVGLGDKVSPTDIEEGMRVGVDRQNKHQIQIPLPPKIDASVTMMTVEEKPDITYNDVGGCKEQIEKIREVVEMPMLQPERFVTLGIDPPKGVLLYGPPGTVSQIEFKIAVASVYRFAVEIDQHSKHEMTTITRSVQIEAFSDKQLLTMHSISNSLFRVAFAVFRVKLCLLVLLPTPQMQLSSVSSDQNWCRNTVSSNE